MEINIYQKAIEQLVLEGYTILQIQQPSGEVLYFNVWKWQESYFNTAQSIDFNTVEGINITDARKNAARTGEEAESGRKSKFNPSSFTPDHSRSINKELF